MGAVTQQASDNYGKVTFADEVIAIIAGLAATEIPGVAAMSGGIAGGIVEKLGKKNLSKGVNPIFIFRIISNIIENWL